MGAAAFLTSKQIRILINQPIFSSEVHKIAILDILILNCDRNEGNILVKR